MRGVYKACMLGVYKGTKSLKEYKDPSTPLELIEKILSPQPTHTKIEKTTIQLRNGSFTIPKMMCVPLPPKTLKHTMGNNPPNHKTPMPA